MNKSKQIIGDLIPLYSTDEQTRYINIFEKTSMCK
jgi:hypothetical protein